MGRKIGVFSGKGGVGKTTLALNLGTVLSNNFRRDTTIVDCNLTASHLGLHFCKERQGVVRTSEVYGFKSTS